MVIGAVRTKGELDVSRELSGVEMSAVAWLEVVFVWWTIVALVVVYAVLVRFVG